MARVIRKYDCHGGLEVEYFELNKKKEGISNGYHDNSSLFSNVNYVNNRQHCRNFDFHRNGNIKLIINFEYGKINGEKKH